MSHRLLVHDFIAAKKENRERVRPQGLRPKNYHFITYKAVFCGESAYARFGVLFTHTNS